MELVFTSSDDASPAVMPRLLRSKRTATGQPFSAPEPVSFPGIDALAVRVWCPQFIDDLRLKFWIIGPKEQRSIVSARRNDKGAEFTRPDPLPFDDAFTLWHLTADGARAYAGNKDGIHLTHRASATERFGDADVLIPASLIGPVEGPIWVAPQEDVIFYCSPGPDKAPGAGRLIWMAAF